MIAAATVLLLLILAVIFCAKPAWGLYCLVATMPFEWIGSWALEPSTGHPVVNLSEIAAAAWLVALAYNQLRRRIQLVWPAWPWWALMAFMAWSAVSAIHIGHEAVYESYVIVILLAATTTAIAASRNIIDLDMTLHSLMASAGIVCLFGIYQFILGTFRVLKWAFLRAPYMRDLFGFPRIHSVTSEPLYFANYLLIPLLIGVTLLLAAPSTVKWWHKVVIALTALDFFLTMSRGAIIGLIVAGVVLAIGVSRMHRVRASFRGVVIGAVIIVAIGMSAIAGASYVATKSPVKGLSNFGAQLTVKLFATGSFYNREAQSSLGLTIAKSHLLLGVGLEGVTPFIHGYDTPRRPNDVIALNNQAVELLAETGIIGTLCYYAFLIWLLVYSWQRYPTRKHQQWGAFELGLTAALVAMTIQAQSFTGFFLMPYWVVYGLLLACQSEIKHARSTRTRKAA